MAALHKPDSRSVFHLSFQVPFLALLLYWWWHEPAPSKAVLVIGVAAVIMSVYDMKWWHKSVWLFLIFSFALLENRSIDKEQTRAKDDRDAAFQIADNTLDTTKQALREVIWLKSDMDNLDSQQQKAEAKHNATLVAQVEAQKKEVQKQILFVMVPEISNELDSISAQWSAKQKQPEYQGILPFARLNSKWRSRADPSLVSAESLRQQLLEELPATAETPEDAHEAVLFTHPAGPKDLTAIATYLRELSGRVAGSRGSH